MGILRRFFRSMAFPILIFLILELLAFCMGLVYAPAIACECLAGGPCSCPVPPVYALSFTLRGIIPNALISLLIYYLIKRYVHD